MAFAGLCACLPSVPALAASGSQPAVARAHVPSACLHRPATIRGTSDDDRLIGTPSPDVIVASSGDDRIVGGDGDDLICAGPGEDRVTSGAGADLSQGGPDADLIFGRRGNDVLRGGDGDDRLNGGSGVDGCAGGSGGDRLILCEGPPHRHNSTSNRPSPAKENGGLPGANPRPAVPAPEGRFSTDPAMFPEFDAAIADYAIRCDGKEVAVSAAATSGSSMSVDGQAPHEGAFETRVALEPEQEFTVSIIRETEARHYHVRCLPLDFPTWNYERFLQPGHRFYVVTPTLGDPAPPLIVIFDDHGVPVWWYRNALGANDGKVLNDGSVAFSTHLGAEFGFATDPRSAYYVRNLDGSPAHQFSSADGPGTIKAVDGSTDFHELQELPNGNFLVISYQQREHVDLSSFCEEGNPENCGASDDHIYDGVIQELDPSGNLVREWSSLDHLGIDEIAPQWRGLVLSRPPHDAFHINAVEPDGNALLVSSFLADAVYRIRWGEEPGSGEIIWKLGGVSTSKSLEVAGDPLGSYPLSAQHDVRRLTDGTITVHDNLLTPQRDQAPRAVRYVIDEASGTATLLEEVIDPDDPHPGCCGSARRSDDGSWLMSWGGNSLVTEFNPDHKRTFRLSFGGKLFSYRAVSARDGVLNIGALRAGMNAMHPG
ncbi:MAG: arylsulfotransferase family protein [Solirubrobacterales bacterium]